MALLGATFLHTTLYFEPGGRSLVWTLEQSVQGIRTAMLFKPCLKTLLPESLDSLSCNSGVNKVYLCQFATLMKHFLISVIPEFFSK